ncbi:MAG: hypothetical protein AMXMBFR12_01120 [Candidatus Babeliales bacterium]
MRYFWFTYLTVFTFFGQQPPALRGIQSDGQALDHSQELENALSKLHKEYTDSLDLKLAEIKAYLHKKATETSNLSATRFESVIDHENDMALHTQLTHMTDLISQICMKIQQLEKSDATLFQNINNLLELDREHSINQEIEKAQKEMMNTLAELCYRQTIRRYQNASAIRGVLSMATNK